VSNRFLETARVSGPLWTATLALDRFVPVAGRWPGRRVPVEALARQTRAILDAWGVAEPETVERHILYADRHGIDSHGVAMLRHYLAARKGSVPVVASPTIVDGGGGGLGHLAADTAMRLAIDTAREHGVGAVAVRNSGHFGAAGSYAAMAVEAGLIGIATTTTAEPAVVPTFGSEAKLGTNALAFGAGEVLLDMATSTASLGRAFDVWRRGRRVPAGWAVNAHGRPERNGRRAAAERRLTPLGSTPALASYKGYGLALMIEVLCGSDGVGHFMLAIDPERFGGRDVAALAADLRGTRPLDPRRSVLVPGDPERAAARDREANGVPLSRGVLEDIRLVAKRTGVPFTL
jgi:LDH2 family malate/lactate/ureidoglycolate dehydrogenase